MRQLFNVPLKKRFRVLAILTILSFLLTFSLLGYLLSVLNDYYYNYLSTYDQAGRYTLLICQNRQAHLNGYRSQPYFFRGHPTEWQKRHKAYSDSLTQCLDFLKSHDLSERFGQVGKMDSLLMLQKEYLSDFKDINDVLKAKGRHDISQSIAGQRNDAFLGLVEQVRDSLTFHTLLTIKDLEFRYLSTFDSVYYYGLKKQIAALKTTDEIPLSVDSLAEDVPVQTPFDQSFISDLNDYQDLMTQSFELDKQIGRNDSTGLRGKLNRYSTLINNQIESIKFKQETAITTMLLRYIALSAILLVVLVVGMLIILLHFERLTIRPLRELQARVEQMSIGDIPEKELNFTREDEFKPMAEALNQLTIGLSEATQFAYAIENNEFDHEFTPLSNDDDMGNALLSMRDKLWKAQEDAQNQRKEEDRRRWATEGVAKFGDILRQQYDDFNDLTYHILSNMVQYLSANQGACFILVDEQSEETYLELTAAYAYESRKYQKKRILPGEGLVGSCWREQRTIYMTKVPEDYINISSGLGDAKPRSLMLVPMKIEEQVFGVIELASFDCFQAHQVAFVEEIAGDIAATLSVAQINKKTAQLLEKSQKQAEVLSAQEEEMRQNVEELQATQEEAARREREAKSFIAAITQTTIRADFDAGGELIYANERFLQALDYYDQKQVLARDIVSFLIDIEEDDFLYQWQTLIGGGLHIEDRFALRTRNDEQFPVLAVFSPVMDGDKQIERITMLAVDITDNQLHEQNLSRELEASQRQIAEQAVQINALEKTIAILKDKNN